MAEEGGWSVGGVGAQGSELVGIHPLVGALVLEAYSLHQLICLRGAAAGSGTGRGEDVRDSCPWGTPLPCLAPLGLPSPHSSLTCHKHRGWAGASRDQSCVAVV